MISKQCPNRGISHCSPFFLLWGRTWVETLSEWLGRRWFQNSIQRGEIRAFTLFVVGEDWLESKCFWRYCLHDQPTFQHSQKHDPLGSREPPASRRSGGRTRVHIHSVEPRKTVWQHPRRTTTSKKCIFRSRFIFRSLWGVSEVRLNCEGSAQKFCQPLLKEARINILRP